MLAVIIYMNNNHFMDYCFSLLRLLLFNLCYTSSNELRNILKLLQWDIAAIIRQIQAIPTDNTTEKTQNNNGQTYVQTGNLFVHIRQEIYISNRKKY